ncbi:MAG: hypothetical protein WKF84_02150 [Pyrinomonadaceae bacterium]
MAHPLWRLGAALDASGSGEEALAFYIKSYQSGPPDPGRRAVIESLYRKLKGSLEGLDLTGARPSAAAARSVAPAAPPAAGTEVAVDWSGEQ